MGNSREDFVSGLKDVAPVVPGFIPFAMITGVVAVKSGLSDVQAIAMSFFMFAGASQLAAVELLEQNAAIAVVVAAALIINLRFMMYSASIATYFQHISKWRRSVLASMLVDQVYAMTYVRFTEDESTNRTAYYLGVAVPSWGVWQAGTVAGVFLGSDLPSGWGIDFVVPLLFLALLFPTIDDWSTAGAAVVGGLVAVAGMNLPLQLGLITGGVVGMITGLILERWLA